MIHPCTCRLYSHSSHCLPLSALPYFSFSSRRRLGDRAASVLRTRLRERNAQGKEATTHLPADSTARSRLSTARGRFQTTPSGRPCRRQGRRRPGVDDAELVPSAQPREERAGPQADLWEPAPSLRAQCGMPLVAGSAGPGSVISGGGQDSEIEFRGDVRPVPAIEPRADRRARDGVWEPSTAHLLRRPAVITTDGPLRRFRSAMAESHPARRHSVES